MRAQAHALTLAVNRHDHLPLVDPVANRRGNKSFTMGMKVSFCAGTWLPTGQGSQQPCTAFSSQALHVAGFRV
eukprot:364995-Chlamydomonas_euryale.AAC.14